jgi:hypothetical protein
MNYSREVADRLFLIGIGIVLVLGIGPAAVLFLALSS